MAGREERLTPATRNYVIFGLLFVVALALAVREWVDPRERRGESDSALRLMIVTDDDVDLVSAMSADGLSATRFEPEQVIEDGRELLKDDAAPAYRAAVAYADQRGYGFVALDLHSDDQAPNWELSEAPASGARFAVFSVGDVAVDGPRMHSFGLPDAVQFEPRLADLDSLRLGLYEHPDLLHLWAIEPNATQLQARKVLDSRGIDERRALLLQDQAAWREVDGAWPAAGSIAGSLAGPWERVQAAPIPGGLLLEVRPLEVHVDVYRRTSIQPSAESTLQFLPYAALRERDPHETLARLRCEGLPEQPTAEVAVAPDGSAVVVHQRFGVAELFVFDQDPAAPTPICIARSVGEMPIGGRGLGRPNPAGAMAWNYPGEGTGEDGLHWWDAFGKHRVQVPGIHGFSGPWWVDGELLAVIGERTSTGDATLLDAFAHPGFERILVLLGTAHDERVRVELSARELFPDLDPDAESAALIDLRPTGVDQLLIATERCERATPDDPRPCVHRLRSAASLGQVIREAKADPAQIAAVLDIETLGPVGPYLELAVASDGSRAVWIDRGEQRDLMVAELRGPNRLVARRIDTDAAPDTSPRISADGQVVVSEIEVEIRLGEATIGSVLVPRAIVLEPDPADLAALGADLDP